MLFLFLWIISFLFIKYRNDPYNFSGPFKGRIVDEEKNQPIDGAVVHVDWYIKHRESNPTYYDSKEVLTDHNGNFYIPGNWSINPWENIVMYSDFIILKSGYSYINNPYLWVLDAEKEFLQKKTPEKPMKIGLWSYYSIRFEGDFPIFLLKKIKSDDFHILFPPGIDLNIGAPIEKSRLIAEEFKKDRLYREEQINELKQKQILNIIN